MGRKGYCGSHDDGSVGVMLGSRMEICVALAEEMARVGKVK